MDETSIIISGFGGQGTLFAGQVLAYASMDSGLEVTWIPSYGPEMRGGTAHCTVIVSNETIGSPLVRNPDIVLALNLPSVDKYEDRMPTGGVLIAGNRVVPSGKHDHGWRDDRLKTNPAPGHCERSPRGTYP